VAASPRGDLIVVDAVDVPYLLCAETGEGAPFPGNLSHFAFGPEGDTLYALDHDSRSVRAMNTRTEEYRATGLRFGALEEEACSSLICSPTRALLAIGGSGGQVRLGDPVAGRWLQVLSGTTGLVLVLAFTPDGRTLVSGHGEFVLFWDVEAGALLGSLRAGLWNQCPSLQSGRGNSGRWGSSGSGSPVAVAANDLNRALSMDATRRRPARPREPPTVLGCP
jgi:WD40 repeat protein